jgi:hypothetical protein
MVVLREVQPGPNGLMMHPYLLTLYVTILRNVYTLIATPRIFCVVNASESEKLKATRAYPSTGLGRAIFESGLPHGVAKQLYSSLKELRVSLDCTTSPLQLLWTLLQGLQNRLEIDNWQMWINMVESVLPDAYVAVASAKASCTWIAARACQLPLKLSLRALRNGNVQKSWGWCLRRA